jgi:hypothetical protein
MTPDRPPLYIIIALAILLVCCVVAHIGLSIVGAGPVYQYATCGTTELRAYDGAAGLVRWGQKLGVEQWTDYALPNVGQARLLSLTGCRVMVRDAEGVLWLDYMGDGWTLPAVGYTVYVPFTTN